MLHTRVDRVALREFGKQLSDDARLKGCGRRVRRGGVGTAGEILDTILYCHRAWLCPSCGDHAARLLTAELGDILESWTGQRGSVLFLTLTQKHDARDELSMLWHRVEEGYKAVLRGSGWRADQRRFRLRGVFRVTEVVHHHQHGWNVHIHALLLLDHAIDDDRLAELKMRLEGRFVRAITVAGGESWSSGQDLRRMTPGTEHQLARYCAKGTTAWRTKTTRTPIAILDDLRQTGEGFYLWEEFTAAVAQVKRRRYSSSHHIRELQPARP